MTDQLTLKVGDMYWEASASLWGREVDNLGTPQLTADEAVEDAREFLRRLSPREREHARAWIRCYQVEALEDVEADAGDNIGAAHTVGRAVQPRDGEEVTLD